MHRPAVPAPDGWDGVFRTEAECRTRVAAAETQMRATPKRYDARMMRMLALAQIERIKKAGSRA